MHIVGLRDVGGERHAPLAHDSDVARPRCDLPQERGILEPISESSLSDTISPMTWAEDGMKVWVNTFKAGWPLLRWTRGFANVVGLQSLYVGVGLQDFLQSQEEKKRLEKELQHLTNQLMHSDPEEVEEAQRVIKLTMRTKHLGTLNISCRIDIDWFLVDDEEGVATVFEFSDQQMVFRTECHAKLRLV